MAHAVGDVSSGGIFTEDFVVGSELGGADVGPQDGGGDILPRRLHYPVKLELPAFAAALSAPFFHREMTLGRDPLRIPFPAQHHFPVVPRCLAHLFVVPKQPHGAVWRVAFAHAWLKHVLVIVVVGLDSRGGGVDAEG